MTSTSVQPRVACLLLLLPAIAAAAGGTTEIRGHAKLTAVGQDYPSDSVFRDLYGSRSIDASGELRLALSHRASGWTVAADYQLAVLHGESIEAPDDARRYLDLTSRIDDGNDSAVLHRLDRLWVGYTSEKTVVRLGRQALSWGNGLFYAPMDLVNPFSPAAIDTEYKAGDDMLYLQYLFDSGADLQAAHVLRRDPVSGAASQSVASSAVKFHGFAGSGEYDLLVARHYDDTVLGVGAGHALGEAQWSADLVVTDTDSDSVVQLSTNLSYSWVWAGKNVSGVVEYHFNGFGQHRDDYDPAALAGNRDLVRRLGRGESFAVGRHYLAGSLMIELTPLWTVSPTVLANISDGSALIQLVTNYSLADNMALLGSVNVPVGSNGTEFGGIVAAVQGRYRSTDLGVFAQFAWYF